MYLYIYIDIWIETKKEREREKKKRDRGSQFIEQHITNIFRPTHLPTCMHAFIHTMRIHTYRHTHVHTAHTYSHTYLLTHIHACMHTHTDQYIQHSSEHKPYFVHTWHCNRIHLRTMSRKSMSFVAQGCAGCAQLPSRTPGFEHAQHLAISLGKQMVNDGIFGVRCTAAW